MAVQVDEDQATLVAKTSDKRLLLTRFSREESLFGDEPELEVTHMTIRRTEKDTDFMLLDKEQRMLYLASTGTVNCAMSISAAASRADSRKNWSMYCPSVPRSAAWCFSTATCPC